MNGTNEWEGATNGFQRSVTVAVLFYGIYGIVAALGVALRKKWSLKAAIAWGVACTYAATGAVAAYGGSRSVIELGGAFVAVALVCAAVAWATRVATR